MFKEQPSYSRQCLCMNGCYFSQSILEMTKLIKIILKDKSTGEFSSLTSFLLNCGSLKKNLISQTSEELQALLASV